VKRAAPLLLLLVAALLCLLAWRGCRHNAEAPKSSAAATATPPSAPASAAVPSGQSAAATVPTSAYRMRALTFSMDASGIRLEQALTTAGRVKAPAQSIASHRLEFEVYNQAGEKIYAGAMDHPLHRSLEYEDPARPGALRRTMQEVAQDSFLVRLPEPLPPGRIVFFEVRPGADGPLRTEVAALPLSGPSP
jgi:hypothetical protein